MATSSFDKDFTITDPEAVDRLVHILTKPKVKDEFDSVGNINLFPQENLELIKKCVERRREKVI
ncbi:MAG: hypothetical protein WCQ41_07315 [Bacillota bacterium]